MHKWLLLLVVTVAVGSMMVFHHTPKRLMQTSTVRDHVRLSVVPVIATGGYSRIPKNKLELFLTQAGGGLSPLLINKIMMMLECTHEYQLSYRPMLTVIDYSLPSNQKRLWVFDLENKKLLFHTYVSHGLKSGELTSTYFSNRYNSKASSIGVYKTDRAYRGREGASLILRGLDAGFNDNAENRALVMHGGWYVEERFIKKYGRAGRSWGCPSLPKGLTQPIIEAIKGESLFVIYYPHPNWFSNSYFLNCQNQSAMQSPAFDRSSLPAQPIEQRDDVLLASHSVKKGQHEENDVVIVMDAAHYQEIFHASAPLGRMLRRQINEQEYIALSRVEVQNLIQHHQLDEWRTVQFASPVIKMERGYYITEMKTLMLGNIKNLTQQTPFHVTVSFDAHPDLTFTVTDRFIRWLGL